MSIEVIIIGTKEGLGKSGEVQTVSEQRAARYVKKGLARYRHEKDVPKVEETEEKTDEHVTMTTKSVKGEEEKPKEETENSQVTLEIIKGKKSIGKKGDIIVVSKEFAQELIEEGRAILHEEDSE